MQDNSAISFIKNVLENMPASWLKLTTHRLDIYNEALAKTEFLAGFDALFGSNNYSTTTLDELPTAYDYIRLGHPLSCVLEWGIAKMHNMDPRQVLSFASKTTPILAILRKNSLAGKNTQLVYTGQLPDYFDPQILRDIYGYRLELKQVNSPAEIQPFNGSTVFISQEEQFSAIALKPNIDFAVCFYDQLGSVILVNGQHNGSYIADIQHVRRRETIAMTPASCLNALKLLTDPEFVVPMPDQLQESKASVLDSITTITTAYTKPLVASSGLSMQYAIMMGLVDHAVKEHNGKPIKFIVPPNCYGGTNDQARRVAAAIDNVAVVDLPVDGNNNMVKSINRVLDSIAAQDAVPYIIAEIPTNPRVEVPDLIQLEQVLSARRKTSEGIDAIAPVFILDQTFCPNVHFLGEANLLATVKTIAYVSGSKFPSGGQCTAGYCVANKKANALMSPIELHLTLCDNHATSQQIKILAAQLPGMNNRIHEAYKNTRKFVDFIQDALPKAKINFVSEELAQQGFTPSVFSLDLPTKGNTDQEKEMYKRELNHKLINLMITRIPDQSKYCVSYGQLQGCYWTIPATSTQGTTKEGDKDYIARVALSANMDLALHKKVFLEFVASI